MLIAAEITDEKGLGVTLDGQIVNSYIDCLFGLLCVPRYLFSGLLQTNAPDILTNGN